MRTNECGRFSFRHIKGDLFFGYRLLDLGDNQQAFVATPEKALLDAVHLHPGGDHPAYLKELRLDYDVFNVETLMQLADRTGSPKLQRAARRLCRLARETPGYRTL